MNISKLLHVSLPWPLHDGLLIKHAVLIVVACFAVEQLSGQTWRMFVTGVSGKVGLTELDYSSPSALIYLFPQQF